MEPCAAYRKAVATYLGAAPEQISLFWKGRVGLYNLLEALGIGAGDEVIVPAFTCVVVPNAILYRGAKVVFIDIDQRTLSVNPELILPKITAKTKVLIAQNTLGLPSDLERLRAIADQHQLFLIDDATHGLHSDPATFALVDAAFYSTQWNKPYSTGLGGMTYVKDLQLARKVRALEQNLLAPGFGELRLLAAQYWVRARLLSPAIYWPMVRLFRWLSEKNWVVGSSQGPELESAAMPQGYNKGMSTLQCQWGLKGLAELPA
ncbi:MAG: DegT/DnrJ/EryC1/StrS aminotransferase family protein, partial [Phaeodactylibacter sp.]|nr:DegT/DnrJ/EryC1/StrS aminotransferase family protein [Phaeodactylibacter sp.]